jgi:2,5-diketo-D-gluconate reductase B
MSAATAYVRFGCRPWIATATPSAARTRAIAQVFDFELTPEEMTRIHQLARPHSRIVNPAGLAPVWDEVQ